MTDCVDPQHCHVALLSGGISGERAVSLSSGEGARIALEEAGFQVTSLDPSLKEDLKKLIDGPFDIAFICLHGKYGEDGTLQGLLEMIQLPYTGSGVWASALAMDKIKSKLFYERAGISTPPSFVVSCDEKIDVDQIVAHLGPHCVVKPATEGSALGVFIVEGKDAILEALDKVRELDKEILIEKYVAGRELTVAVLGNKDIQVLPIIEIVPENDFYDYEAKYSPGASAHICPAPLSDDISASIKDAAAKAHLALECRGVSRSDFILDDNGIAWLLETNTIPGMTGTSLLPDAAKAANISFSKLCTMLIRYAFQD